MLIEAMRTIHTACEGPGCLSVYSHVGPGGRTYCASCAPAGSVQVVPWAPAR